MQTLSAKSPPPLGTHTCPPVHPAPALGGPHSKTSWSQTAGMLVTAPPEEEHVPGIRTAAAAVSLQEAGSAPERLGLPLHAVLFACCTKSAWPMQLIEPKKQEISGAPHAAPIKVH